ncbi:LAME_0E02872g1_1 [Lachancea meyersii CBS 8951]|uniref:LAME_0E02872g1_1 n=1 Tax=Lachancea meyersii CBS 8951 TaxID=1266667 RepID=A0A1G4JG53_9SACH|nr:LAME_0E02872g1_1 [Lachancea meyersii CBS 8951]
MPLAPKYLASHTISTTKRLQVGKPQAHVIELYLDYCCPFSKILYLKWIKDVIPAIEKQLNKEFEFQFVHVAQPWHPSSGLMHEAALAVAQVDSGLFQDFSKSLFEQQAKWFDEACYIKSRKQIYEELASLATSVGVPGNDVLKLLTINEQPFEHNGFPKNGGNAIGPSLKYFTRYHRQNGAHVTPTVAVNGIINGNIGSGTSPEEVIKLLDAAT